ncbi:60S ribosomal protein L11-1 [Abeliophyllum distichum]|uniref:60S ribosomal protein L11-1 n=1 Tax=Abeliophyllum distichum TaxID=126358 RepID=A0ABD1QU69_9LAMI
MQLSESGLKVKEYELLRRNFSDTGCFGFGVQGHIDLGIKFSLGQSSIMFLKALETRLLHVHLHCVIYYIFKYDLSTGIYGMDFFIVLERPGDSVVRRHRCKSHVGIQHRVTKEDTMKWSQVKYEGVILIKSSSIA